MVHCFFLAGNCSPRYMRSSVYSVPCNQDMLKESGIPMVVVTTPFAKIPEDEVNLLNRKNVLLHLWSLYYTVSYMANTKKILTGIHTNDIFFYYKCFSFNKTRKELFLQYYRRRLSRWFFSVFYGPLQENLLLHYYNHGVQKKLNFYITFFCFSTNYDMWIMVQMALSDVTDVKRT